jgi:hypothetical protein
MAPAVGPVGPALSGHTGDNAGVGDSVGNNGNNHNALDFLHDDVFDVLIGAARFLLVSVPCVPCVPCVCA